MRSLQWIVRLALPALLVVSCAETPTGELPPEPELCCRAEATDWPRPSGPDGTGRVPEGPALAEWPAGELPTFFRREIGRGGAGVVVQGTRVVSAWAQEGYELVFCLDRRTGSMLWHVPLGEDGPQGSGPLATPILTPDGRVIAVGSSGVAVSVDVARGREVWRRDLAGRVGVGDVASRYAAVPLFERGLVVVGGAGRRALAALDSRDGSLVWVAEVGGNPSSSPVRATVGDRVDLIVAVEEGLVGVDPETGARRWIRRRSVEGTAPRRAFFLGDGRILLDEAGGRLTLLRLSGVAVDPEPEEIWSDGGAAELVAAVPGPESGLVLVEGDRLVVRDAGTGVVRSSLDRPGIGWVVGVGKDLLTVAHDGLVGRFRIAPDGPELVEERRPLGAVHGPPALSGAELFLRGASSLVGIELPVAEAGSPGTGPEQPGSPERPSGEGPPARSAVTS